MWPISLMAMFVAALVAATVGFFLITRELERAFPLATDDEMAALEVAPVDD